MGSEGNSGNAYPLRWWIWILALLVVGLVAGCGDDDAVDDGDGGLDGSTDSDGDTDSDTDSDSDDDAGPDGGADGDSDTDTDTECACSPQQPETFGDCDAGEEIEPTVTEVVESVLLYCDFYTGPTTPSAAAEVDFFAEFEGGNSFAVFRGDVGWADFKTVCMAENPSLTEDDFPVVDFSTQRAVFFVAIYEYECTSDGIAYSAARIGDLDDGSVQINGYLYSTGTEIDCDLEGFEWWERWLVVLDTTSEIRTCLELAVFPPA